MNLKIYTQKAGIIVISALILFSCKKENPDSTTKILPFGEINGFIIDKAGTKILATNKGLFSLNEDTKAYEKIKTELSESAINDMVYNNSDNSELLWLASDKSALEVFTNQLLTASDNGFLDNNITHLDIDEEKKLYLASDKGISIMKDNQWIIDKGLDSLYMTYPITDIGNASNGYTYATTLGGGVERFKCDVDGISGATIFEKDWTKLESDNILTVYIDDTVQVFGTEYGVAFHYSEYTKWDWETYTTDDGLVSDTVLSITKDNDNNWWFGTVNGLSKFSQNTWTNYKVRDAGFLSDTINYMAIDTDGSLWCASNKGLSHFQNNQWTNF